MSTAALIIILGITALAALGLILLVQSREKAKIEKARQRAAAEDAFRHNLRILEELPAGYLNKDLRQVVLSQLELLRDRLHQLGSPVASADALAEARTLLQEPEPVRGDEPLFRSREEVRQVTDLLETLFQLVEKQRKAATLSEEQARPLLQHILYRGLYTQARYQITLAQGQVQQEQLRKAIFHYNQALSELSRVRDNPEAARIIGRCRRAIQELEAREQGQPEASQPSGGDRSLLDEEMDRFLKEEDAWKKRSDFDS